ncbi:hypothetical protein BMI88_12520 [Thioclava sp. F36-6]|nr:hypothetical protein BMI88_12520 [Thioclava sp. F36-6]
MGQQNSRLSTTYYQPFLFLFSHSSILQQKPNFSALAKPFALAAQIERMLRSAGLSRRASIGAGKVLRRAQKTASEKLRGSADEDNECLVRTVSVLADEGRED